MNLELIARKNEVGNLISHAHMNLLPSCEMRWERWRPDDYLAELRRAYLKFHPNHLGVPVLEDPVFFFRSIQNTRRDVFPELGARRDISFPRMLSIRNAGAHDGVVKMKTGDDTWDTHELNKSDVQYLDECCTYLVQTLVTKVVPPVGRPTAPVPSPRVQTRKVETPLPPVPATLDPQAGLPQLLTFYVLCDTSTSMFGKGIEAVNRSIEEMHATLLEDPVLSDKVRIAMLSFSSNAAVELPLARPCDISNMPTFSAAGVTNYSRVLDLVGQEMSRDIASLRATHRPLRPVVFVVTDGAPTDDTWLASLDRLVDTSNPYVPKVVIFPCGFDTTRLQQEFGKLTLGPAPRIWPMDPTKALEDAVRDAINSVTRSIVQTAAGGGDTLVVSGE